MKDISELDLMNQPDEGDPLIWLRKHREELSERFPNLKDLCDYYKQFSSVEVVLARVHARAAEKCYSD
ncbi:MAG: hypothetical protein ACRC10_05030 [Thermoguttaceae bacterium]